MNLYFCTSACQRILFLVMLLLPLASHADEKIANDLVIKAMAQDSSLTEEEIREHYKNDCLTDFPRYAAICAKYNLLEADLTLNKNYKELMRRLADEQAKSKLKAAQRAWISFRDLQCEFETSSWGGGRFQPTAKIMCIKRFTEDRAKLLGEYLLCEDSPECFSLLPK